MKKSIINFLLFVLILPIMSYGQSKSNELGIRLSSFDDIDITWHKKISEEKFKRIRVSGFNLQLNSIKGQDANFNFYTTIGVGKEKRKTLGNNFNFIHGVEWGAGVGLAVRGKQNIISIAPYVGYVIGFQYFVNPNFAISIEALPRISVNTQIFDGDVDRFDISTAGLTGQMLAVTAKYCFGTDVVKSI